MLKPAFEYWNWEDAVAYALDWYARTGVRLKVYKMDLVLLGWNCRSADPQQR